MNKILRITILVSLIFLSAHLACAQEDRDTVYISHRYTTTFYFPTNAVFARLSSEDNAFAAYAKETKEVIYVRARGPFTENLSLTVIESSGRPHTYILLYDESPRTLLIDEKNERKNTVPDTLYASSTLLTTVVFSTEIVATDLSRRRLIKGDIIEQSPNVFSVMAREKHEELSSLSILEESGLFHTFIIKNDENPKSLIIDKRLASSDVNKQGSVSVSAMRLEDAPSLAQVHELPQSLYHIGTRQGKITVVCENIFTYSDIMFITLRLDNKSGVSYETDGAIFTVENRKKTHRTDDNKMNVIPSSRYRGLSAPAGGSNKVTYAFKKLTLNEKQCLVVKIYEKGYEEIGGRSFVLKLTANDVNLARRPEKSPEKKEKKSNKKDSE